MKSKKVSRQTVLNKLEKSLLASANVWTDETSHLYEEILTTPHFDPLPVDAVVSMMYRSAHPVPPATVQKIVDLAGKDLIARDYQIVASYWKNALHNAKSDLLFLRQLGFKAHRLPDALISLLSLKTSASDQIVIEELNRFNLKAHRWSSDSAQEHMSKVVSQAMVLGRVDVLRAIPQEKFNAPGYVANFIIPCLLKGCAPSPFNNFSLPAHAFSVTQLMLENLDGEGRKEAFRAITDQLKIMMVPHNSFKTVPEYQKQYIRQQLSYLEEIYPLWNDAELKRLKVFFSEWKLPPLSAFQSERIHKILEKQDAALSSTPRRKM